MYSEFPTFTDRASGRLPAEVRNPGRTLYAEVESERYEDAMAGNGDEDLAARRQAAATQLAQMVLLQRLPEQVRADLVNLMNRGLLTPEVTRQIAGLPQGLRMLIMDQALRAQTPQALTPALATLDRFNRMTPAEKLGFLSTELSALQGRPSRTLAENQTLEALRTLHAEATAHVFTMYRQLSALNEAGTISDAQHREWTALREALFGPRARLGRAGAIEQRINDVWRLAEGLDSRGLIADTHDNREGPRMQRLAWEAVNTFMDTPQMALAVDGRPRTPRQAGFEAIPIRSHTTLDGSGGDILLVNRTTGAFILVDIKARAETGLPALRSENMIRIDNQRAPFDSLTGPALRNAQVRFFSTEFADIFQRFRESGSPLNILQVRVPTVDAHASTDEEFRRLVDAASTPLERVHRLRCWLQLIEARQQALRDFAQDMVRTATQYDQIAADMRRAAENENEAERRRVDEEARRLEREARRLREFANHTLETSRPLSRTGHDPDFGQMFHLNRLRADVAAALDAAISRLPARPDVAARLPTSLSGDTADARHTDLVRLFGEARTANPDNPFFNADTINAFRARCLALNDQLAAADVAGRPEVLRNFTRAVVADLFPGSTELLQRVNIVANPTMDAGSTLGLHTFRDGTGRAFTPAFRDGAHFVELYTDTEGRRQQRRIPVSEVSVDIEVPASRLRAGAPQAQLHETLASIYDQLFRINRIANLTATEAASTAVHGQISTAGNRLADFVQHSINADSVVSNTAHDARALLHTSQPIALTPQLTMEMTSRGMVFRDASGREISEADARARLEAELPRETARIRRVIQDLQREIDSATGDQRTNLEARRNLLQAELTRLETLSTELRSTNSTVRDPARNRLFDAARRAYEAGRARFGGGRLIPFAFITAEAIRILAR